MRTRIMSTAVAVVLATSAMVSLGASVMAQTTQTILVAGTYNGPHSGGPFAVPAGTSLIEVDVAVTDAPTGANFTLAGDTSVDGGATWQTRVTINCPGGTVVANHGAGPTIDASCNAQMGIYLDPAKSYLARFSENSGVAIQASASLTIF